MRLVHLVACASPQLLLGHGMYRNTLLRATQPLDDEHNNTMMLYRSSALLPADQSYVVIHNSPAAWRRSIWPGMQGSSRPPCCAPASMSLPEPAPTMRGRARESRERCSSTLPSLNFWSMLLAVT
mmetsp:Transcript_23398/g.51361  ORF Transcript_23398/g.51361 Transcript_23398/m.51361 type:complete len:125 (+) Transcript_23398:291-665(+)